MKTETLERGNKLQKQIKELKAHLEYTFRMSDQTYHEGFEPFELEYSKLPGKAVFFPRFYTAPFYQTNARELRNEFIPFPIDKFMKIYKANVEEEIARLEKEFANLQDEV
jgi:hypothetical protein